MRRPSLEGLPALEVPEGYRLRTYRKGDEAAWGAIMESPEGIGKEWTEERVRASMMEKAQFEAEGLGFVPVYLEDEASDHVIRWSEVFAKVFTR